jgi:hypothetical protein
MERLSSPRRVLAGRELLQIRAITQRRPSVTIRVTTHRRGR